MAEAKQKLESETWRAGLLLGQQERLVCERIAAGEPPHSQRALSLLAIDSGATEAVAAQQSGQTVGQVRYWLGKFRNSRMSIFPEALLPQAAPEHPPSQQSPDQPAVTEALDLDQPEQQSEGPAAEAELVEKEKGKEKKKSRKGKGKKKRSKKVKKPKKARRKKKRKSGKKRKGKRDKKQKKKQGKKNRSGKSTKNTKKNKG